MDVSLLLDELNKPQRQAVSAGLSPILVLAGAGSGKTRVLVHRVVWLLQVEQVSPFSILAVTFTNKAANEMRGRITDLLQQSLGGLWVGTFHGIAHRLLRRHWQEAKLPQQFQIIDSDDQFRMVKRVLKGLDLDKDKWPPRQAQSYINKQKDEGIRPQFIEAKGNFYTQKMIQIYQEYEAACKKSGVIDFAEMLLCSLELLRDNVALLQHYQQRFQHILVDEFQDTNTLQYAWLRLLAGSENKVFAVGDDDQSIYGWRGAKIENIQNFSEDFSDAATIRLEQNYRSSGNILKAANALIQNNTGRLGKKLWTADKAGSLIDLYKAYNESDEARYVIARIQTAATQGQNYADMAILYRSNAQSRIFEMIFAEKGIPYRVYGGLRFFDRAEIKDTLSYLRLSANRHDDPSFERVINLPTRGIGAKTVDIIRNYSRSHNISLWHSAGIIVEAAMLPARATNAVRGFLKLLDNMSTTINTLPLHEQVDSVIETTLLKDHYKKKEKGEKSTARIDNLNELVAAAKGFHYEPQGNHEDMDLLSAFLSHAILESGEIQSGEGEDCVQMMTLHAAKGLEFPLVFLAGVEENLFPHRMSLNDATRLEEERRLCYVGITRARQQLVISYAEQRRIHGSVQYNLASQFIREIPNELLNEVRLPATAYRTERSYNRLKHRVSTSFGIKQKQHQDTVFKIGQRVRHHVFATGVIIDLEGEGNHAQAQVNFDRDGHKWLVLRYAKLEKI
jgi:DNA helicase-2/ATP-dependent DNA helicase PcrA